MMSADGFLQFPLISLTWMTRHLPMPRQWIRQLLWFILLFAPHVSCFLPHTNDGPSMAFLGTSSRMVNQTLLTFIAVHILPWCMMRLIFRKHGSSNTNQELITGVNYRLSYFFLTVSIRNGNEITELIWKAKRSRRFQTHQQLFFTELSEEKTEKLWIQVRIMHRYLKFRCVPLETYVIQRLRCIILTRTDVDWPMLCVFQLWAHCHSGLESLQNVGSKDIATKKKTWCLNLASA